MLVRLRNSVYSLRTSSLKIAHQRRRPKSIYPISHHNNGRLRLRWRWICHPIWPFEPRSRLGWSLGWIRKNEILKRLTIRHKEKLHADAPGPMKSDSITFHRSNCAWILCSVWQMQRKEQERCRSWVGVAHENKMLAECRSDFTQMPGDSTLHLTI